MADLHFSRQVKGGDRVRGVLRDNGDDTYSEQVALRSKLVAVEVTPTITTTAYSAADGVGGIQTIAGAFRAAGVGSILKAITVVDTGDEDAAFEITFFKATPTGGTYTDNGGLTYGAGDAANVIGRAAIASAGYVTTGGVAVNATTEINLPVFATAGTSLFALITTSSTPTYAVGDLRFIFHFEQD